MQAIFGPFLGVRYMIVNLISIPSVYHVLALNKNVLSLSQLKDQGFDVTVEGDKCYITIYV